MCASMHAYMHRLIVCAYMHTCMDMEVGCVSGVHSQWVCIVMKWARTTMVQQQLLHLRGVGEDKGGKWGQWQQHCCCCSLSSYCPKGGEDKSRNGLDTYHGNVLKKKQSKMLVSVGLHSNNMYNTFCLFVFVCFYSYLGRWKFENKKWMIRWTKSVPFIYACCIA